MIKRFPGHDEPAPVNTRYYLDKEGTTPKTNTLTNKTLKASQAVLYSLLGRADASFSSSWLSFAWLSFELTSLDCLISCPPCVFFDCGIIYKQNNRNTCVPTTHNALPTKLAAVPMMQTGFLPSSNCTQVLYCSQGQGL